MVDIEVLMVDVYPLDGQRGIDTTFGMDMHRLLRPAGWLVARGMKLARWSAWTGSMLAIDRRWSV